MLSDEETRNIVKPTKNLLELLASLQLRNGSIFSSEVLTHHFATGLLDCGYDVNSLQLHGVKSWFLESLKEDEGNVFAIATLIDLGIRSAELETYLKKLVIERQRKDGRFEFNVGYKQAGDLFSTLFGLKMLHPFKLLGKYKKEIDHALKYVVDHKDDSTSLRDVGYILYILSLYDFVKFKSDIKKLLDRILEKEKNGIWGNNLEINCWMILDLLDLRGKFDQTDLNEKIEHVIDSAIKQLMKDLNDFVDYFYQFVNDNATNDPIVLEFSQQYVLTAVRILSTFSKYWGNSLTSPVQSSYLLETTTSLRNQLFKIHEFFEDAYLKYINVNANKIVRLTGGYSDSSVFRIQMTLSIPGTKEHEPSQMIVKVNSKDSFELEQRNFAEISNLLKHHFAEIPESEKVVKIDDKRVLFMQDLFEYETLEEILSYINKSNLPKLASYVADFLTHLYSNTLSTNLTGNIIHNKYLNRIFNDLVSIRSIQNLEEKSRKIQEEITLLFVEIIQKSVKIEPAQLSFMHGDLNLRNLMIYESKGSYDIKLIDIDKLSNQGDYVFDIGELLANLKIQNPRKEIYTEFENILENKFREWQASKMELKDDLDKFQARLHLSQACSLIKLAKISFHRQLEIGSAYLELAKKELEQCLTKL